MSTFPPPTGGSPTAPQAASSATAPAGLGHTGFASEPRFTGGLPGPVAPPASVILLLAFGLMLIGVILRSISGMMDLFADSTKDVFWIGNLIMGIGLFGASYAMFNYGIKDEKLGSGVRTGAMISGVLLILLGIVVSSNLLGQFGNVVKSADKMERSERVSDHDRYDRPY
jgi:hypothetical protein